MAYLLDANVFIQAKNLHYGFDFCPAFWDWLVTATRAIACADAPRGSAAWHRLQRLGPDAGDARDDA